MTPGKDNGSTKNKLPEETGASAQFSDFEKAAMKQRAKELKQSEKWETDRAAGEKAILDKIAEMDKPGQAMAKRVHELITTQEQQYSWTFMYMGADQDAIEQGAKMGITADRSLSYTQAASGQAYDAMSGAVRRLRTARSAGMPMPAAQAAAAFTEDERNSTQ